MIFNRQNSWPVDICMNENSRQPLGIIQRPEGQPPVFIAQQGVCLNSMEMREIADKMDDVPNIIKPPVLIS